jgi:hypothetical protein
VVSRPRIVNIALVLLLAAAAAFVAMSVFRLVAAPDGVLLILTPGIVLGLLVRLALIDVVARRKNWARILLVALIGLWLIGGLPADVMNSLDGTRWGAISLAPLSLMAIMSAAAAVLLFLPESNAWFRDAPAVPYQSIVAAEGEWFYAEGVTARGPISETVLRSMLRSGSLDPEALVWTGGMTEWRQATTALGDHASEG